MRYYIKNLADSRTLGYGESIASASVLAKKMSNIMGTRIGIFDGEKLVKDEEYENGNKIEKKLPEKIEITIDAQEQPVIRTGVAEQKVSFFA
jgi:hypothetical protein